MNGRKDYERLRLRQLLIIGRSHAHQQGLTESDAQDCALIFAEYVWQLNIPPEKQTAQWLARCAANWAQNYRRGQARLRRHEAVSLEAWAEERFRDALSDRAPAVGETLYQRELRERLEAGLAFLKPKPRDFLLQHFLDGKTYQQIADETGERPDAVRQAVTRACKRVRVHLEKQELNEAEALDYLSILARGVVNF